MARRRRATGTVSSFIGFGDEGGDVVEGLRVAPEFENVAEDRVANIFSRTRAMSLEQFHQPFLPVVII